MTTYAQDIRNALRALGGTATAQDIADRCECDIDAGSVSKQLWGGEQNGWVMIDRSVRPFQYTLVEDRAGEVEAFGTTHIKHHDVPTQDKPPSTRKKRQPPDERSRVRLGKVTPGQAKRELTKRTLRAIHADAPPAAPMPSLGPALSLNSTAGSSAPASTTHASDVEWSERIAQQQPQRITDAAETLAREIDRVTQATLPRDLVLRLCALALSPDEPSANDRRDIATAIKAAA